jgi:hypothetical protein
MQNERETMLFNGHAKGVASFLSKMDENQLKAALSPILNIVFLAVATLYTMRLRIEYFHRLFIADKRDSDRQSTIGTCEQERVRVSDHFGPFPVYPRSIFAVSASAFRKRARKHFLHAISGGLYPARFHAASLASHVPRRPPHARLPHSSQNILFGFPHFAGERSIFFICRFSAFFNSAGAGVIIDNPNQYSRGHVSSRSPNCHLNRLTTIQVIP